MQPIPTRAVDVDNARKMYADLVGRPTPFTRAQMWRYARLGYISIVRIGRRVYFRMDALEQFVATGGTPKPEKTSHE